MTTSHTTVTMKTLGMPNSTIFPLAALHQNTSVILSMICSSFVVLKVVFMGSSLFHKLLLDDSNEDEIIKEVVMDSTS